jgi:hypothetical protein
MIEQERRGRKLDDDDAAVDLQNFTVICSTSSFLLRRVERLEF